MERAIQGNKMARRIREEDLQAIEEVVRQHPEGRTAQQRRSGSIALLRDVFIWAYERSAARYAAVRQSLGEPDPFRMQHRTALREVVGAAVRGRMDKKQAAAYVSRWTQARERFREVAERELLSLHERNFARYRVRPSEFAAWQEVWSG